MGVAFQEKKIQNLLAKFWSLNTLIKLWKYFKRYFYNAILLKYNLKNKP